MLERFVIWLLPQLKPREGWLPLFLLTGAVGCVTGSLVTADWIPEGSVVGWTGTLGLLLGVLVAKRSFGKMPAFLLTTAYGITLTTIRLANLINVGVIWRQDIPYGHYFRGQFALFIDRWAGWIRAVFGGGSSQETIVFAFGLGVGMWLLAAYTGWTAFRVKRPLLGLTALGMVLAFNSYYSSDSSFWLLSFLVLTILSAAILNFVNLEQEWLAKNISYADQVRWDLLAAAGVVALFLVTMANIIPAIDYNAWAKRFQQSAIAEAWEDNFGRAFAGVRSPARGIVADGPGGSGVLPRSFLLGNPPELAETVVMTATVNSGRASPNHWRALSYDVYTGRGWARSEERQAEVATGQRLGLPPVQATVAMTQTVHWLFDDRSIRYTLGLPIAFDQPASVRWRGATDLVRVLGNKNKPTYAVISQGSVATVADLRTAQLADVPPALLARYTALPDDIPQRVQDLATELTAEEETPYDKAKAVERFLRQYAYSLDVVAPATRVDPVDYFLFDLQAGYCDYYASAMVVLLRNAGIPTRLAIGYLAQPPAENGVQTIVQLNAHSWAEVYFANYGWIEFEPTAPFRTPFPDDTKNDTNNEIVAPQFDPPVAIPDQANSQRPVNWQWGLVLLAGAILLWAGWRWHKRRKQPLDAVAVAYAGLQKQANRWGVPTPHTQTPDEFAVAFQARLASEMEGVEQGSWWGKRVVRVNAGIYQLTQLFIHRQYRGWNPIENVRQATTIWQKTRPILWKRHLKIAIFSKITKKKEQLLDKKETKV